MRIELDEKELMRLLFSDAHLELPENDGAVISVQASAGHLKITGETPVIVDIDINRGGDDDFVECCNCGYMIRRSEAFIDIEYGYVCDKCDHIMKKSITTGKFRG
jgi:predicted RNA-binding Zn-ribbon protein involved in translation (DUF1610 family)